MKINTQLYNFYKNIFTKKDELQLFINYDKKLKKT